ncbi:polyribonucleotide nucleotidyltransferase, partial [Elusimicrobiota bacterium]
TVSQLENSEFNIIIAGSKEAVVMMEGEAKEIAEEEIIKSIELATPEIAKIIELQDKIIAKAGKEKKEFIAPVIDEMLEKKVKEFAQERITEVLEAALPKHERSGRIKAIKEEAKTRIAVLGSGEIDEEKAPQVSSIISKLEKELLRKLVTEKGIRVDGRKPDEIRGIECEVGLLPRTHGSAIFTKGETQALAVTTLGSGTDQQIMDALLGEYKKNFMLHYNFPPFSVGEVRPNRGTGRREIGHGLLAEKALSQVLPDKEEFPYTVRLVSDILESNGSSSMATVCAGTMALMDAGVPMKAPVAGVGMGIIDDVIIRDLLGDEDHAGDMDFKVAGTKKGITAIQMDIKVAGISREILQSALEQAKEARLATLAEMEKEISESREKLSQYAPQLESVTINKDKIGALIGPGGKNIKKIQEEASVEIDIEDTGVVTISAQSGEDMELAKKMVIQYTAEAEPGKIYDGTVKKIMDFGAFVEILPGKEGLVHISELAAYRVSKVTDVLKDGDAVRVKCTEIDQRGRINLSRVQAMTQEEKDKEKSEGRE